MCQPHSFTLLAALTIWATALAIDDVLHRRVLNVLLLPVALGALGARFLGGWAGCELTLMSGLIGAAAGFALWLPGYAMRQVGAGDVKLAATFGLVLGTYGAIEANLFGALFLGVFSFVLVMLGMRKSRMPAAPMLALAFVVELWAGPFLLTPYGARAPWLNHLPDFASWIPGL
ncbi:A24 family peptidase [Sinimarinibacterium sp. NLF-5-8]|uniref:prepilin peptidase n=1 Tax=Sinimarinibacterium sp. NLF-5-8 TaxID=2698684 RepID=UPI00137C27F6|nr:A24 family peptidase [Sinimarinibacterium sp. NLF-5-8]QHS11344.1 prepilin peptidase [Sinimarinibacterium sp. NLF-5-8]